LLGFDCFVKLTQQFLCLFICHDPSINFILGLPDLYKVTASVPDINVDNIFILLLLLLLLLTVVLLLEHRNNDNDIDDLCCNDDDLFNNNDDINII
jgi:hypothetical protein